MASRAQILDRAAFEAMWRERDVTILEMAVRFDVSGSVVYSTAERFGLPSPAEIGRKAGPRSKVGDPEGACRCYRNGMAVHLIAVNFGVSEAAIRHHIRRDGWKRKGEEPATRPVAPAKPKGPKLPNARALEASFTLRRLDLDQVEALAKSCGTYAALEALADEWGKPRTFLCQCWHDYEAAV